MAMVSSAARHMMKRVAGGATNDVRLRATNMTAMTGAVVGAGRRCLSSAGAAGVAASTPSDGVGHGELIQNARSRWPATAPAAVEAALPPRTVPDAALSFKLTSSFDHGTGIRPSRTLSLVRRSNPSPNQTHTYSHTHTHTHLLHRPGIYFPHMKMNPADFKVALMVCVDDLGLSDSQLPMFLHMVGQRYNVGNRTVKLTSDRFPNRIENKRYLVVVLENLLRETRRLDEMSDEEKMA